MVKPKEIPEPVRPAFLYSKRVASDLTQKQGQVFRFIVGQIENTGLPPTIREIAGRFDVYPKAIQDHVAALERKGYIKRVRDRARGLLIDASKAAGKASRIPVFGRVPAGAPLEAVGEIEDYLAVDEAIAKRANFALRVKGDSMSPQILDGDVVLIRHSPVAEDGALVVATVDDNEATIKKLRRSGREVYLEAVNPAYPPLRGRQVRVIGRVTSLIRTYF